MKNNQIQITMHVFINYTILFYKCDYTSDIRVFKTGI